MISNNIDKKRTDYQKYEIQSQLVQIPSEVKRCTESNGDFRSTNIDLCLHQIKASLVFGKHEKIIVTEIPFVVCFFNICALLSSGYIVYGIDAPAALC